MISSRRILGAFLGLFALAVSVGLLLVGLHSLKNLGHSLASVGTSAARLHSSTSTSPSPASPHPVARQRPSSPSSFHEIVLALAVVWWIALVTVILTAFAVVNRRLSNRLLRDYGRYEIRLSMHDEAKPRDLQRMVEGIGLAVRALSSRRMSEGQPFFAFELFYGKARDGMRLTLCLLCEQSIVGALQSQIMSAYRDIRIGNAFGESPEPVKGVVKIPGCVLRFRKRRSFAYPLNSELERSPHEDGKPSPSLEHIARAMVATGVPCAVRFQFIPAMEGVEDWARRHYYQLERSLARSRRPLLSDSWGSSALDAKELQSASEIQAHALFWMEVQVAADNWDHANQVAAALTSHRGANHLHRRFTLFRQGMYRRRFPSAYPPLLPAPSMRTLVSAGEIAPWLELPGAEAKDLPFERLTHPRLPAPPEIPNPKAGEAPGLPDSAGPLAPIPQLEVT